METNPRWILSVLDDLLSYAEANCRPEVSIHIGNVQCHLEPYLVEQPPAGLQDPKIQAVTDVLQNLIRYAKASRREPLRLHLLAAQRVLQERSSPTKGEARILTLPFVNQRQGLQI